MARDQKILLYCFFILNITVVIVIVNVAGAHKNLLNNNSQMAALTILNNITTTNSPNLRGSSFQESASQIAVEDSDTPPPLQPLNPTENPENPPLPPLNITASLPNQPLNATKGLTSPKPLHPFEQLSKRLGDFDWDPVKIDEYIRKYWKTEKSFLRYQVDKRQKKITPILSTSCLQTAGWIVTGLLGLQTRPNIYTGLYKVPNNKSLIVYKNIQEPPSTLAKPISQSIKSFIASQPVNESIILQVDMYQIQNESGGGYIDHHFNLHFYNGQVSMYQGWLDIFNLIDWMQEAGSHKLRYPMPIDTFLGHFEKFLTYTEQFDRERLEATWEIFGITDTFVYSDKKENLDHIVRALRYPWVVSLITHWPEASQHQLNELPVLSR